jgi:hypothetical protein
MVIDKPGPVGSLKFNRKWKLQRRIPSQKQDEQESQGTQGVQMINETDSELEVSFIAAKGQCRCARASKRQAFLWHSATR